MKVAELPHVRQSTRNSL